MNFRLFVFLVLHKVAASASEDLVFVHIPKTGGTTIEEEAYRKHGILWGRRALQSSNRTHCSPWHAPPSLNPGYYSGRRVFCVVRHPLDRLISEYRWRWFTRIRRFGHLPCNAAQLNMFVMRFLSTESAMDNKHMGCHMIPQVKIVGSRVPSRMLSDTTPYLFIYLFLGQTSFIHTSLGGTGGQLGCTEVRQITARSI